MSRDETASAPAAGGAGPRRCVYTALIGGYEQLNEQPAAARSNIPFVCFTDDPGLRSETWRIRLVTPEFGMDPSRSQRDVKIRAHRYLPEFDESLYIDNTVLLTEPPERVFEAYTGAAGLSLFPHSFRETTLDEFLVVARLGLDEPARIFEQLNHYLAERPEVVQETPYWGGILLRAHNRPDVVKAMETWAAHVFRYARRDQLSVNFALRQSGLAPNAPPLDNHASWFHTWPHSTRRREDMGPPGPLALSPPMAQIRSLEQRLAEEVAARRAEQAASGDREAGLRAAFESERTARADREAALARREASLNVEDERRLGNALTLLAGLTIAGEARSRMQRASALVRAWTRSGRRRREQAAERARDRLMIAVSGLFDPGWYMVRNPDTAGLDPLAHFLDHGGREGRAPGPDFDSRWYLDAYPDVAREGVNPLVHYLRHGLREGRRRAAPFRSDPA